MSLGKGWLLVDLSTTFGSFKIGLFYFDSEKKSWSEIKYLDISSTEMAEFKDLTLIDLVGNQGFTFLNFYTVPKKLDTWSTANCIMSGEGEFSGLTFKCTKSEEISFPGPRQPDDNVRILRNTYNPDSR